LRIVSAGSLRRASYDESAPNSWVVTSSTTVIVVARHESSECGRSSGTALSSSL
jgi:hypothetical protein